MLEIHVSERREGALAENRNAEIRLPRLRVINFIRCKPVHDAIPNIRRRLWQGCSIAYLCAISGALLLSIGWLYLTRLTYRKILQS